MNHIELKPVIDLLGLIFYIPDYQRGYRWTERQVEYLLEDIKDFIEKKADSFYCLQPLAVMETIPNGELNKFIDKLPKEAMPHALETTKEVLSESTQWEVIDGQQRLTTIKIILTCLYHDKDITENKTFGHYSIDYATRSSSTSFLDDILEKDISDKETSENIDFYHMVKVKETVLNWFNKYDSKFKRTFLDVLLNEVKFIWYEISDEDPIQVFTRLNIGKISLTSSELIKALLLNRSNFEQNDDYSKIRMQQSEIAGQWDNIEYTLQNEEFWLFIHDKSWKNPTRIDYIFNIIVKLNLLNIAKVDKGMLDDRYGSYYYFDSYFRTSEMSLSSALKECWKEVLQIYDAFKEWNSDLLLYHYIGYIIDIVEETDFDFNNSLQTTELLNKLLTELEKNNLEVKDVSPVGVLYYLWKSSLSKKEFVKIIINIIDNSLSKCKNLDKQYTLNNKRECMPILLLHNLQTIINQNQKIMDSQKYALPIFYKFPFHLYKRESWDVEHIDSNTTNELKKVDQKREWLLSVKQESNQDGLNNKIDELLNLKEEGFESKFDDIRESILKKVEGVKGDLSDEEKNKIGNFTLLDYGTNRSYGNSIFPTKRRKIISKTKGISYEYSNKENKFVENKNKDGFIAFVPIVTQHVFDKDFTLIGVKRLAWYKEDATNYINDIYSTLNPIFKSVYNTSYNEEKNDEHI